MTVTKVKVKVNKVIRDYISHHDEQVPEYFRQLLCFSIAHYSLDQTINFED